MSEKKAQVTEQLAQIMEQIEAEKNSGWLMIQKGLCCYYKQQAER